MCCLAHRELPWLFYEPHTGLHDCLNMLLSCFSKRMSVPRGEGGGDGGLGHGEGDTGVGRLQGPAVVATVATHYDLPPLIE